MRITQLVVIGILVSLTTAAVSSNKPTTKPVISEAKISSKSAKSTATVLGGRSSKSLKTARPGEARGKRTLYDLSSPAFLYPQIAARRAGFDIEPRSAFDTQSGLFNGQNAIAQFPSDYNVNYSPYPQYLEAPEPIIEIIIKDSNETLPETSQQPSVAKPKKKKEKVHVFYVNYKKDQNNKLHLESPIASLNNDETEEEEDEEEDNVVQYTVTPLPPLKSTTLRTIIHPDSEKYHSNSGIHVTFGSEDKSQTGHILEEHDAESVQRQVVAVPVPHAHTGPKPQLQINARTDFQGEGRSPYSNGFFRASSPWQYHSHNQQQQQQPPFYSQQQHQQQQLPNQHSNIFFKHPVQTNSFQQNAAPPQSPQFNQQHSANFYHKQPFNQQTALFPSNPTPSAPPAAQQMQRKPLSQIYQQLQQQSQYYVNHNQLYQPQQAPQHQQQQQQQHHQHVQHQQQSSIQHQQFYNAFPQRPTQPPKPSLVFPTAPGKSQELPLRQTPQPYQPIKFRPTPAAAPAPPQQSKPTHITAKLENTQYNAKPYLFQKQPQFIQHPTFTISAPTPAPPSPPPSAPLPSQQALKSQIQPQVHQPPKLHAHTQQHPQHQGQQQQQQQQHQYQPHSYSQHPPQTSNVPQSNSIFYTQNKQQQQQQVPQQQVQQNTRYQAQSSNHQTSASLPHRDLNWVDIRASKETELLKSIPKFEQHITETVQNHYNTNTNSNSHPNQYQAQNQVIHDIPAPNLAAHSQAHQSQSQALQGHYITSSALNSSPQIQPQQLQHTFSNFVTAPSHLQHSQLDASSTQSPQFGEATDGQKIMIVTPMPPNVYEQYQASQSYQASQNSNGNHQHATQIINSIQPSQEQYNHYYQHPRQGQSQVLANSSPYSVSNYHSDVFKELEQRNAESKDGQNAYVAPTTTTTSATTTAQSTTTVNPKTLLQLPDEVPDDLRQQLLSSGILGNADISVLDYDKVGETALENLPAEHLQHFYGAGGGAQISESKKVLTVLKTNGDKVSVDEKQIDKVKETISVPNNKQTDVKIVRYDGNKSDSSELLPSKSAERQYNRYLPLKINGANFPKSDIDELREKVLQSVVVLAPVDTPNGNDASLVDDTKEVKFLGGDLIKSLVKKPTKENFKRWLDKEARTDVEQQSVVLLVAKTSNSSEQEIFMYDITTSEVNKLNGELSSKFVNVAEENASTEDLEHGSTLDPNFMETMMQPSSS